MTVEVRDQGGRVRVSLLVDGERQKFVDRMRVPPGLALGQASTSLLGELGGRMSGVVFPGEVGVALDELLDGLDAGYGGRCPYCRRRAYGVAAVRGGVAAQWPSAGVAAGGTDVAPDEGQTPNVPLDVEAEMGSNLDAVSEAVRDWRAQVRILEVAHPETIRQALAEDDYHAVCVGLIGCTAAAYEGHDPQGDGRRGGSVASPAERSRPRVRSRHAVTRTWRSFAVRSAYWCGAPTAVQHAS